MFLGSYQPNFIGKNRISLPKKIRNELTGERIVLVPGLEKCLYGFSEKGWEEIIRPEMERPLYSDTAGRDLRRKMCVAAAVVDLDSQGRFVIPDSMLRYAGIEENLVLIGAGDHFEIWSPENWQAYLEKIKNI